MDAQKALLTLRQKVSQLPATVLLFAVSVCVCVLTLLLGLFSVCGLHVTSLSVKVVRSTLTL